MVKIIGFNWNSNSKLFKKNIKPSFYVTGTAFGFFFDRIGIISGNINLYFLG